MPFLEEFFSGRGPQTHQLSTVTPQQENVLNQLLGSVPSQLLQSLSFEPIAQAAQQRFQQQTLPTIAERFGSMNAKRSSGYNQAIANAMENLQTNLAGQQAQFQQQGQSVLANLLGLGLRPQFENVFEPGQESGLTSLLREILPMAARAGIGYATGGASEIGNLASQAGGALQGQIPQSFLMRGLGG